MLQHYDHKKVDAIPVHDVKHKDSKKTFTMIMPPPNVTGSLHIGHALNNTYYDIVARWYRLNDINVVWVPGTDHAGISTQYVVEKKLFAEEKKRKEDIGRTEFVKKIYEWKDEYRNRIFGQLKSLGCSCNWEMERFTMDEQYCKQVKHAFIDLYNKKLVYRAKRIINWCCHCKSAISDDEVISEEIMGKLYHLKYMIDDKTFLTVATSRPETIFGDVAVAYHPEDERYKGLHGECTIPIINKKIKIITDDEFIKPEFGTGLVKITPAHDENDFIIGKKNKLEEITILTADGKITNTGTIYDGMDRFECRKKLLRQLEEQKLLQKITEYKTVNRKCYKCSNLIEAKSSLQWFVDMKPFAKKALDNIDNISFYPTKYKKTYSLWLENIKDWCISRQIWWGHQIPVFYCDCGEVSIEKKTCTNCAGEMTQDTDVLDTWFSSWLWAFAVFEDKQIEQYYPVDLVITGSDILFFWITRMIFAGLEFTGKMPFKSVYLHGIIRDVNNQKMAKTKGNVIDPLVIIEKYGTDALRFGLVSNVAFDSDAKISDKTFEDGKKLCTKLWNACRFYTMKIKDKKVESTEIKKNINKWILGKLELIKYEIKKCMEEYRFTNYAKGMYEFFWNDFCSLYLEVTKNHTENEDLWTLHSVLKEILILFHPIIPFITTELWNMLFKTEMKFEMKEQYEIEHYDKLLKINKTKLLKKEIILEDLEKTS